LGDGPIQELTAREREVLKLLVAGLTNKEIGKKLGIQEVTVKLHLRGIFRKFSVSNRTQALRIAIQHGWRL
jgi:DNA-binding NarL/FixJ family response regulator